MAEPVDLPFPNISPDPSSMEQKPIDTTPSIPRNKFTASLPLELRRFAHRTDETLFRLEKLLSTSTGLETCLAPLNYTLHLLIYFQSRRPIISSLLNLLTRLSRPSSSQKSPQLPSSLTTHRTPSPTALTTLNDLITSSRNTLRLTALLPLYTHLRTLLSQSSSTSSTKPEPLIHSINIIQTTSYILYQLLENIAHLSDLSLSHTPLSRSTTTALYLHSNRFWLLGLTCDLVRLCREASLERRGRRVNSVGKRAIIRSQAEQKAIDQRWRDELLTASCWWPLVLNWSLANGLRGVHDGVIGVLGVLGAMPILRERWADTDMS